MFKNLDKTKIKTKILYDKVIPLSNIKNYSGNEKSGLISLKKWRQILFEMKKASIDDNSTVFNQEEVIKKRRRKSDTQIQNIPIAILNLKYNRIKSDAVQRDLLTLENGILREKKTTEESPYLEERVFAASTLSEETYHGNNIVFSLDPNSYISNTEETIEKLEIDFDDGKGLSQVDFNNEVAVNYTTTGSKTITLKATLSDNSKLISRSLFRVKSLSTPKPHDTWQVKGNIEYEGDVASGKAYIYTTDSTTDIRNPVIIVEGFDPVNERNWDELYNIVNKEHLAERLRAVGHDLIILNFDNGADYIQRNAFLLVELIKKVNSVKYGSNQLVVIGASMGGLVSRYALAYMEKNNIPHDTRLFISFDSPQRGANIPLGIQYWLKFFKDNSEEVENGLKQINSIAAKQMLLVHYKSDNEHANGLRTSFVEELDELSYPSLLRKIAISNGSGFAIGQSFKPKEEILEYNGEKLLTVIPVFIPYNTIFPLPVLVKIASRAWSVPINTEKTKVFYGRIWVDGIRVKEDDRHISNCDTPFDNSPGGMTGTASQIAEGDTEIGRISTKHPNHCFIPSISSLDIDTEDFFHNIANDADILSKTPFDAIYYPKQNEDHITITPENAEYFINEIHPLHSKTLYVSPQIRNVPASENICKFNIAIKGSTSLSWTATSNDSWLSIIDDKRIVNSKGTISVKVQECPNANRIGSITISAPEVENSPITVQIKQGFQTLDYYWVGGSGNWSDLNHWATTSNGNERHKIIPSENSNVYFDENSFTQGEQSVVIDIPDATCNNMEWRNVNNGPIFKTERDTQLFIYGSLAFSFDMNTSIYKYSPIYFKTKNQNQQIFTAGKYIPISTFDGQGEWIFQDRFEGEKINMISGKLNTNGQIVQSSFYSETPRQNNSEEGNSRTIVINESVITSKCWNITSGNYQKLTINTVDSLIKIVNTDNYEEDFNYQCYGSKCKPIEYNDLIFSDDDQTIMPHLNSVGDAHMIFNSVFFKGHGRISGNNSFKTLHLSPARDYVLEEGPTQNIVQFNANGNCLGSTKISSSKPGSKATISIKEGKLDLYKVTLKDIHGTGGAQFTAIESKDNGNNEGWTFIPRIPRNLYWVGGSGNWNDITHWQYIKDNGQVVNSACIPTSIDNVYFNSNSFSKENEVVVINTKTAECNHMDWRGVSFHPVLEGETTLNVYGSLFLDQHMTFNLKGCIRFLSEIENQIIDTANNRITCYLYFQGTGGWLLQDHLECYHDINHDNGTFNTNSKSVRCHALISDTANSRKLIFGASKLTLGLLKLNDKNLTFDAGTSFISFINSGYSHEGIFHIGDQTLYFYDVEFKTDGGIYGENVFNNVTFYNDADINGTNFFNQLTLSTGHYYTLDNEKTQTVNSIIINDSCEDSLYIYGGSYNDSTIANIFINQDDITIKKTALQSINVIGNAKLIAMNSWNIFDISGQIIINEPEIRNLYWINGTGNWHDPSHWSLSSNGKGGAGIPTPTDNVIFDDHSFKNTGEVVTIDKKRPKCRDMDWSKALYNPKFKCSYSYCGISIFGSIHLIKNMEFNFYSLSFHARTKGHSIFTGGKDLKTISFYGVNGEWTLHDNLNVSRIYLNEGSFNTNSYSVNCSKFYIESPNGVTLENSKISVMEKFYVGALVSIFDAGTSLIQFYDNSELISYRKELNFYDIDFLKKGSIHGAYNSNFHTVQFHSDGTIGTSTSIDKLILSSGKKYIFGNKNEFIFKDLSINNNTCVETTLIKSSKSGEQASFYILKDHLNVQNVLMQDIHVSSKTNCNAFNSIDLGNNNGWIFNKNPESSRDLFWVGGSGNWNDKSHWSLTSGGNGGECFPTIIDNVFFDANSFIENEPDMVTMNVRNVFVNNMDWSKANYEPKLHGVKINDYEWNSIYIDGSLKLINTMDFNFQGNIYFTGENENTVDSGGQALTQNNVYFQGRGSWTLTNDLNVDRINFNSGTLNTNNVIIYCRNFYSLYQNPRQLLLGSSMIIFDNYSRLIIDASNLIIDAGTSIIKFRKNGELETKNNSEHIQYNSIYFLDDGTIRGDSYLDILKLSPGHNYDLYGKVTILSNLEANGNCKNSIMINGGDWGYRGYIVKAEGEIEVNNVIMNNVKTSGNATFIAKNSVDNGGNDGWLFKNNELRNLYWVGGTGLWSEMSHWSLSSGGSGGECPPTEQDNVIFDENSFSKEFEIVRLDLPAVSFKDMTWEGVMFHPTFEINRYGGTRMNIYGSMVLIKEMNVNMNGHIYFLSGLPGQTIATGGHPLNCDITFKGDGEWILQDELNVNEHKLVLESGSFVTNNYTVTCSHFNIKYSKKPCKLKLGSSIINTTIWDVSHNKEMFIDSGESTIKLSKYQSKTDETELPYFKSINQKYYKVMFMDDGEIDGSNTFDSLIVSNDGKRSLHIVLSGTQTILNKFEVSGNCYAYIFLEESSIIKTDGKVELMYTQLKDIKVSGGAEFIAYNSIDLGGNTGWQFIDSNEPKNLYWVNGTGNWDDSSHWSYQSGGEGGACLPTSNDNVFFDKNSFSKPQEVVTINTSIVNCKDMKWIGAKFNPTLKSSIRCKLAIYGSLFFIEKMNLDFIDMPMSLLFKSHQDNNQIFIGTDEFFCYSLYFDGSGSWVLKDNLHVGYIGLIEGTLDTNGYSVTCSGFSSDHYPLRDRSLILGDSTVNVFYNWHVHSKNLIIDPGRSTIIIRGEMENKNSDDTSNVLTYNNVIFKPNLNYSYPSRIYLKDSASFNSVTFDNNMYISGNNFFKTLILSPGHTYQFNKNTTQTIIDNIEIKGNCTAPIYMIGNENSSINKAQGSVNAEYVFLENIIAKGGAEFIANNSIDNNGNNDGWVIYSNESQKLYWVGGSGYWHDPSHWSFTSGGDGNACIPTPKDDVFFDENSFNRNSNVVKTFVFPVYCRNMDWSNAQNNPSFDINSYVFIHGSIELINDMIVDSSYKIEFRAEEKKQTIKTCNHILPGLLFNGNGGWILNDHLNLKKNSDIIYVKGELDTNGKDIICHSFISESDSERHLNLSTSKITVYDTWKVNNANLVIDPGRSIIQFVGDSSEMNSIIGNNIYHSLIFNGNGTITGDFTLDSLTFSAGKKYFLGTSVTAILHNFKAIGEKDKLVSIIGDLNYYDVTLAAISVPKGFVYCDYLQLKNIKATGGAKFYAGINSVDMGNNTGWIFEKSDMTGDLSDNNQLDIGDAIIGLQSLSNIYVDSPINMRNEINGNRKLDMMDIIYVMKHISGD